MADLTRIQDHVWKSLSFRQRLAGRVFVNRVVARAVKRWPDKPEESSIAGVVSDVEKEEVGMGIILMFVVGALVNQIVQIIFEWWKSNRGAFDA
jgi:hypothetical protein